MSVSDSKLLIDGLRLRLDLRIVPGQAGADAAAAAVWRIENPAVTTLRLGVPVAYRRAAIASGVGALALAVGVWLFAPSASERDRPGRAPPEAQESVARPAEHAARVAPRPTELAVPVPPAPSAAPPPVPTPGGPAASSPASPPAASAVFPASAAPSAAAPGPAAPAPSAAVVPAVAAHPAAGTAPSTTAAAGATPAAAPAAAAPASPPHAGARPAEVGGASRQLARGSTSISAARERDMLDLFGDPK